ncbi:MAG: prepilin-type N-terminal cleavage/methylation domain-containing protein [Desulfobacteraceae bacterium]|nr:prepilin-type N-terminal cleavage/methylation domain-containing protein [Desulfobacteraceae bacterium]
MNKHTHIQGFTLFELMVVISILAVVLTVFVPIFRSSRPFSDSQSGISELVNLIQDLKKRAVQDQADLTLHIDTGRNYLWVEDSIMDEEMRKKAKEEGVTLRQDFNISGVEFKESGQEDPDDQAILFSKQGYSDFALIHLTDDETDLTIRIEPFLYHVEVVQGHEPFEECI